MRTNDSVYFEETLRVSSGFEAPHALLPLARRLMRVLCPIVQVTVLTVTNIRHDDPLCGGIAAQLVGNDHPWMPAVGCSQQLAKEPHRRQTISFGLHQNINHHTLLIDGPPEIMPHTIDVEEDLVQMPLIARPRPSFPQPRCELLPELFAPSPNRFVADQNAAGRQHFFDVPETHRESIVEPNGI